MGRKNLLLWPLIRHLDIPTMFYDFDCGFFRLPDLGVMIMIADCYFQLV
jgi:hypothetical protein